MRRAPKIDANHPEIVEALRKVGCSVQGLAAVGHGCPDLLVGRGGVNYLLEVKDGRNPPSERRLTDFQIAWHLNWHGKVVVVNNVDEALRAVGITK